MLMLPPEMELTEAERNSPTLPDSLECDGCQAVTYQIHVAFAEGPTVGDAQTADDSEQDTTTIGLTGIYLVSPVLAGPIVEICFSR